MESTTLSQPTFPIKPNLIIALQARSEYREYRALPYGRVRSTSAIFAGVILGPFCPLITEIEFENAENKGKPDTAMRFSRGDFMLLNFLLSGKTPALSFAAALLVFLFCFSVTAHACQRPTYANWNLYFPKLHGPSATPSVYGPGSKDRLRYSAFPDLNLPGDAPAIYFGRVVEQRNVSDKGFSEIPIETKIKVLSILKGRRVDQYFVYKFQRRGCGWGPVLKLGESYFVFVGPNAVQFPEDTTGPDYQSAARRNSRNVFVAKYARGAKWLFELKHLMSPDLQKKFGLK